jgi:hypothetical protein
MLLPLSIIQFEYLLLLMLLAEVFLPGKERKLQFN